MDAYAEGLRAEFSGFMSSEEAELLVERALARMEVFPDEPLPLYGFLHGDRDGGLWVAAYVPGVSDPWLVPVSSYDLIGSDGVWIGTLDAPQGFTLLDVAGDRLLGVLRSEFDVLSIAVYRLDIIPLKQ